MDDECALHYLAGFFDGEGTISIGHDTKRHSFSLMVVCSQLDPKPILLLFERFGGNIKRTRKDGYRDIVVWFASGRIGVAAIKVLRPYLRVKAKQADIAMAFYERMDAWQSHGKTAEEREAEFQARYELYEQLKGAKHETYDHIALPTSVRKVGEHGTYGAQRLQLKFKPKRPPKPKHVRVKVAAPIRSAQGRSGAPRKGESKKPDAATLESQYRERGPNHLARTYGVTRQTIYNWLDSYGIPRMGRSAASEHRRLAALKAVWKLENQDGSTA